VDVMLKAAILLLLSLRTLTGDTVRLDRTEYIAGDTARYESFRLHLLNPTDSLVVIDCVETSCGCILATLQNRFATREHPGDVYVALTVAKLDSLQPVTVDVYTNATGAKPLRLYIRRQREK
jgi:hypothetical protein